MTVIVIVLFVLVITGTLGMVVNQAWNATYEICTVRERAVQLIVKQVYETIDDPKAKQILNLLYQGQQIDQSSKNYLDSVLMKKDIKINNFLCGVVNNIKPTENTGLTNCETHNGADGIDGLSSGDTG